MNLEQTAKRVGAVTLTGSLVTLEPLSSRHVTRLLAAATVGGGEGPLLRVPTTLEGMSAYVDTAISMRKRGKALPFVVIERSTERVIGSTRFCDFEYWKWPAAARLPTNEGLPDAVGLGWTWMAPDVESSSCNSESKLLLLSHAFDHWKVKRVSIRTDARNVGVRASIESLGAKLDGVLRAHRPGPEGEITATASYSILASEWGAIHERLVYRLSRSVKLRMVVG